MFTLGFFKKDILQFASAGNLINNGSFLHSDRILDTFVLLVGVEGALHIMQGDEKFVLLPNQYLILFPHIRHCGFLRSDSRLSYFWCHFYLPEGRYQLLPSNQPSIISSEQFSLPDYGKCNSPSRIHLSFRHLIDSYKQKMDPCGLDLLITLILVELAQMNAAQSNIHRNPNIERLVEYINRNYSQPLSIGFLANMTGYNPNYLSTLFKQLMGLPLIKYINRTRLDAAKELLLNSSNSVKSIAAQVGFRDEKHFMKCFRANEKMTPSVFRNAYSKNHINNH